MYYVRRYLPLLDSLIRKLDYCGDSLSVLKGILGVTLSSDWYTKLIRKCSLKSLRKWLESRGLKYTQKQLSELTKLYLCYNGLTKVHSGIGQLTQLVVLDLRGNKLTELPDLVQNTQLEELYLTSNYLTELPEGFLARNTTLEWLYLGRNKLVELPEGFLSKNATLRYLNLGDNELTYLPEDFLAQNTQLIELNLNGNKIIKIPNELLTRHNLYIYNCVSLVTN